jgi:hypothetical protein
VVQGVADEQSHSGQQCSSSDDKKWSARYRPGGPLVNQPHRGNVR